MKRRRSSLLLVALVVTGCNGQSCSALGTTPGGFPSAERMPNAGQVRLSATGVAALAADPTSFATELFGGSLNLSVPASCGGSPALCCPGGTPGTGCGPIVLDPVARVGDQPRLVLTPVQGASRLDVTLRMRVKTMQDIPVTISPVGDCGVRIDTTAGSVPDIALNAPISFVQDSTAGTTRLVVGTVSVTDLATEDVALTGSVACSFASAGLSFFLSTITNAFADALQSSFQQSTCKACPSGQVSECGNLATACTSGTCMIGSNCLQELGAAGRLLSSTLFDGAPPGTASALDVHAVAGGYATSNSGGLAFGVLGGAVPAGTARDRCGPAATPPPHATVPMSPYFQGNTRPDDGSPFDVAIGLHQQELSEFAYAAYDSGSLCATFDADSVPTLTSDALLAIAPSLAKVAPAGTPLFVGLRPQQPPTLTLGANTFDAGGNVTAPLVSAAFTQMELDVFAAVETQPIRVMTLAADFVMPLGAKPGAAGEIALVLGPLSDPTNVSVENVDHLDESPAILAALAPPLQGLAFPEMVKRLGPLVLPRVVGKAVTVQTVTAVDSQTFVGIFGSLTAPAITSVVPPPPAAGPTTVTKAKTRGGGVPSRTARDVAFLGAIMLLLAGVARRRPKRALLPTTLVLLAGTLPTSCGSSGSSGAPGHGETDAGPGDASSLGGAGGNAQQNDGGSTQTGGQAGAGGVGIGGAGGRAADSGPGSGGTGGSADAGAPCGATACVPGDVVRGGLGQWSSADSGSRTVVTTYDAVLGDLVLVDLTAAVPAYLAIDGVPSVAPTHDPSGYRGGIEAPGPDVGAWTSVRLAGDRVRVAYQDRDRSALRFSLENATGAFTAGDVDLPDASHVNVGEYASLALGAVPAIAYRATSAPSAGSAVSELRFARAANATPGAPADWSVKVVASATAPTSAGFSGTALFINLVPLPDGRFVIVHYDRTRTALIAQVESAANSGTFTETVLDGADDADRGRWASAVADAAGKIHVAYQDGIGHQVFYLSFTPGAAIGTPEVVDDGVRAGDRAHWVGGGLALWLDGTSPHVAYQDASGADAVQATRTTTWSHADLAVGVALDAFHIAAPAHGAGLVVWDQVDPNVIGSHRLFVHAGP